MTTRELMLLRHAKSDWGAGFATDRDRPLNERGRRSARAVGDFVTRSDRVPELALTSPAVRAATTLELAMAAGHWPTVVQEVSELYSGGPGDLIEAVRRAPDVSRLLVVGHEPTMSSTLSRLIGGGSFRVPTAALVVIRFTAPDWSTLEWDRGELDTFVLPRSLVRLGFGSAE